jgi:uncharacterized protein (TIGR03437 family)
MRHGILHRLSPIVCLALSVVSAALAYQRLRDNGMPLTRGDFAGILYSVAPAVVGGLTNSAGQPIITPESDPVAALQASLESWNGVAASRARFRPLGIGDRSLKGADSLNVFHFEDTPEAREMVGSAIAVAQSWYYPNSGRIIDTDIVFNPTMVFSTIPSLGAFDIQSIATHELGHALGADHSPLESAAMYPYASPEETAERWLSPDDIAFVTDAYPLSGPSQMGAISVRLRQGINQSPVNRGHVVAIDRSHGAVVGADPLPAGAYRIGGLPPGSYFVYAEPDPLSEDVGAAAWQPAFFGGNSAPAVVTVSAGAESQVQFTVEKTPGPVTFDFLFLSVGDDSAGSLGGILPSGLPVELLLFGSGFDAPIATEDVLLFGPGLALRPDSVEFHFLGGADKSGWLRAVFDIAPQEDWAAGAVGVRAQGSLILRPGLRIRPAGPWFTPSGTVNAASYQAGGVAPGEIVSIFGVGMGPLSGISTTGFDSTGRLSPDLGGVSVKFNGVPAPLYYASSGQINCQAPFEVAGSAAARVEIRYAGRSDQVFLPVVSANPAVFLSGVLNANGRLNSTIDPIARGDVIVAYGTGQGLVQPPLATGQPALLDPLSLAGGVTATVGGQPAVVEFAGMTPGLVGLLQVNVRIPNEAIPGDLVPLVISVNNVAGPETYISVK